MRNQLDSERALTARQLLLPHRGRAVEVDSHRAQTRSAAAQEPSDKLDRELILIALVVVSGLLMSVLDTTIVNVALQTLSRDLHSGLATVQWVITGYLLALALVMPISGWAIDRFGAKRMFLLSIVLFAGGSSLCALAWSTNSLIGFRVLQGLGGGLLMPVGQTIVSRAAGPARMGRVMSVIGVPLVLGPVLGPVIGGLIVDNLAWQWIFLVNLPVGLLALALCARVLPRDRRQDETSLDLWGLALMSPGLAALIYGLSRAGNVGTFDDLSVVAPGIAGIVLLAVFVLYARRRGEGALIPVGYFSDRAFSAASIVTVVVALSLFGAMLLLPLYFQQIRGHDALYAGLLIAPQGVGAGLGITISGVLADKLGARYVVAAGIVLATIGTIPLGLVSASTSYGLLTIALVIRGFGVGTAAMPAIAAGYQNLPASAAANASTTLNILRQIGASIGTALMAVILATTISHTTASGSPTPARLAGAFGTTFWWAVAITAGAFVFAFLLPRRGPQPAAQPSAAAEHGEPEYAPEARAKPLWRRDM